jgi:protocatechuate 3,4-dioxygenase beta subunit
VSDSDGKLRFTTIFPGCYPGRWPHLHFEVYPDLEATAAASNKLRTSQLALTRAACELVFATPGYEASGPNLAEISLATDGVFADSAALQLAELSGSVRDGYTARLTVAV